jgi:AcrR family transcriptional regulator
MASAVDALLAGDGVQPRADARRNAERLVAAARTALEEQGLGITTRDIAQRAGVGLGTLYRRVPSLEALLTAILVDAITEMTKQAARALDDPDPWRGFAGFAERYVQLRAASCGLHAALSGSDVPDLEHHVGMLRQALQRLIHRCQAAHVIREDLDWRDIAFALASAIPPASSLGLTALPDQWRRNLRVTLDGLRPPAPD